MKKTCLILLVGLISTSMTMILACGGGGGGGSTTTFNGVVYEADGDDNPAQDATVELWREGLVMLDSDQTDLNGIFNLVGSNVVGVDVFFKVYKDPGHVPLNTMLLTVPDVSVLAGSIDLPLISENVAIELGSAVWGNPQSSWNSTAQGYAYVVFEVNRSGNQDTTPDGVTVLETGAGGAILNSSNIYYNDGSDVFATVNMTSQSNSTTDMPDAAARLTTADAPSPGIIYSFETSGHPDGDPAIGTIDAYLIPGEITIVVLEP